MKLPNKITIVGSSSAEIDKVYLSAAQNFALELIKNDIEVIFGGGAYGIMGTIADTLLENNGKLVAIVIKDNEGIEIKHKGLENIIYTENFNERKSKLLGMGDALVIMPGGCGTIDELFEAITLKRLGQFLKPIVILNTNNYYTPILEMLNKTVNEKFMNIKHLKMWVSVNNTNEILLSIANSEKWLEEFKFFATNQPE